MIPYSHVLLFSGLTNCKYTLPYLISTVKIGRQKKADGSENEQPDYPSLFLPVSSACHNWAEVCALNPLLSQIWGQEHQGQCLKCLEPLEKSERVNPWTSTVPQPTSNRVKYWSTFTVSQQTQTTAWCQTCDSLHLLTQTGNLLFLHWGLQWEF